MNELKPLPMTAEEAISILNPETTSEALLPYAYDPERRIKVVEDACRIAVAALRRAQPANEPLTLEQLREMDGEQVFIPESGKYFGGTGIVDIPKNVVTANDRIGGFWPLDEYEIGEWIAYRRPPEGSEHSS